MPDLTCLDHVIATENVKIALSEGKLGSADNWAICLPTLVRLVSEDWPCRLVE